MSGATLSVFAVAVVFLLGGALAAVAATAGWVLASRRARLAEAAAESAEKARITTARESDALLQWKEFTLRGLDALDLWWLRVDRSGTVVAANSPDRIEVQPARVVVGQSVESLFPASARHALKVQLARAFKEDRLTGFEFGEAERYASVHVTPIGDEAVVVMRDLTAKKAKETRLQETKERYALAAQGANDGLWDWNLVTGEVYWSWMFRRMVGDEALEARREAWFDKVHPDDRPGLIAALGAHIEGEGGSFSHEHRVRQGDGWAWLLARGMAVRNAEGRAERLAGSLTDLTNRRVVQVTAEKATLLEHATSSVDIGIGVVQSNGALENPSPTLARIAEPWGLEAWWEAARARSPKAARKCETCKKPERVGTVRLELESPEGDPRVHEVSWTGHAHEVFSQAGAHVIMVSDVTEAALADRRLRAMNVELEQARDAALEASRLKSAFLANMSHELRTPLNHIVGYAELVDEALEDSDDAETRADVGRILDSGRELSHIVGRLLDLSRIEAEGMEAERTQVELAPLVAGVAESVDARGNTVRVDIPAGLEAFTDGPKLAVLLRQLIDNATKFTTEGTVEIEARRVDGAVRIDVRDTGIGMNDDVLARLFKGYFQADTSHTRAYDGTGLGLVLADGLARVLGAEISVESTPGAGSCFTVVCEAC